MSVEAITWAYRQAITSSADKFVLVTLCNWANEAWVAYPSVNGLAEKTGLDAKTVRAALKRLADAGFIVDSGDRAGSTKQIVVWKITNEAKVPENGSLPFFPGKATENGSLKGTQKRATDTKDKPYTKEETKEGAQSTPVPTSDRRKTKRPSTEHTIEDFLEHCKTNQEKAIPEAHAVMTYAKTIGLPNEMLRLAWMEFKARHIESGKKYKDWRQAFHNCVKGNWYKLWWLESPEAGFKLTTVGMQADMEHKAHA